MSKTVKPPLSDELLQSLESESTSIASANEVEDAIAQQAIAENPHVRKQQGLDAPVENIMDKAVSYIKSQTDKKKRSMQSPKSMVITQKTGCRAESLSDEHA